MLVDNLILQSGITPLVAVVVCLTMCVTVFCAKIIGCVLPILAKKVGFDPAVMASPFITTIVDAVSLIVYFQIASMVLGI
jgi:magnesium transporter